MLILILIAGITGNPGQALAHSALSRGHQVCGLGRSLSKLSEPLLSSLESFVSSSSFYDIPAIETAVVDVDAIIAAYATVPGLTLEGQLILPRAAERAGVKRYVATSWNYDWTKIPLGKHESYDEFVMFKHHAKLSSSAIKPIYVFTGVLAEFLFRAPSDMTNLPELPWWDPEKGTAVYYGNGTTRWQWTTFQDAAEYTVEIVTADGAENGGSYSIMSDAGDVFYIAKVWKEVTGKDTKLIPAGNVKGLEDLALAGRKAHRKSEWKEYIGPFYWLHTIEGDWNLDEDQLFNMPNVKPLRLLDFLEMHKDYYTKL